MSTDNFPPQKVKNKTIINTIRERIANELRAFLKVNQQKKMEIAFKSINKKEKQYQIL